jgi:uncharacterized protein (DUF305 family)
LAIANSKNPNDKFHFKNQKRLFMKKQLLLIAATGSLYLLTACGDSSSTAENTDTSAVAMVDTAKPAMGPATDMKTPVQTMMEKVKTIRMTGDFDRDFANVMLLNHQEAVDISKMAVTSAKDPEIKEMAQRMVTDHESEIEDLKKFVAEHDTTSVDHKTSPNHTHEGGEHHEFADDLNTMMSTMASKSLTGDVDRDYVTLMLAHHQNAVSLEEDEVTHGQHAQLKSMAKEMMADDKKEITKFEKWLAKMK